MNNEINEVYLKVDNMFKLGLKAQLKGTELFFERLLLITDLLSDLKCYILIINSKEINFENLFQLYTGLTKIIEQEMYEIEELVKSLEKHLKTDLVCDKTAIHYELEVLGNREDKLFKTFEKIKKNIEKIK